MGLKRGLAGVFIASALMARAFNCWESSPTRTTQTLPTHM
jgi:hypothetical protein